MYTDRQFILETLDKCSGSVVLTDTKGRVLYANRAVEEKKCDTDESVLGNSIQTLWGYDPNGSLCPQLLDFMVESHEAVVLEVESQRRSGSPIMEEVHMAPLLDQDGTVKYFIELDPDVSHGSKLESFFDTEFLQVVQSTHFSPRELMAFVWRWMVQKQDPLEEKFTHTPGQDEDFKSFIHRVFLNHGDGSKLEDRHLVELAQSNHEQFRGLYEKYYKNIYHYFYKRVNGPQDAEELSQETFVRAFGSLDHFKYQNCTYLSYLLMIAHNLLVNYYRSNRLVFMDEFPAFVSSDESDLKQGMELQLLWERVHELGSTEETVLTMKYKEDQSVRTIARSLGKSENAIKLILSRARKKLQKKFSIQ